MAKRFPWKSNYLRVPPFVTEALGKIESDLIQVAATKKIPRAGIESGQYAHVGLRAEGGQIVTSGPVLPPCGRGQVVRTERRRLGPQTN